MKKGFLLKRFRLLMIGALLMGASAQAVVNWHGGAIPGDVTDQDIDVMGANTISGPIVVTADTTNVDITISADSSIRGISNNPRLFLIAKSGKRITVHVDNNLMLTGDASDTLLVTVEGAGAVEFVLEDGKKVSFTSDAPANGGTRFFVHNTSAPVAATLLFKRKNLASANHVEIEIGPKSILSYISSVGSGMGLIKFDPGNVGLGRMVLRVKDGGAVYVRSNKATPEESAPALLLSDIDMTTYSGGIADFIIHNPAVGTEGPAGLLVLNENTMFTDLVMNPWEEVAPFSGLVYGFVVADRFTVGENSYLDYVGLTNNFCPTPDIPEEVLAGRIPGQVVKERNASAFIVDANGSTDDPTEGAAPFIKLEEASAMFFRSGVDRDGTVMEHPLIRPADTPFSFVIDPAKRTSGAGEIVVDFEAPTNIRGCDSGNNKIEILSLEVAPTGAPVLIEGSETNFPLRTFSKDVNEDYLQYNAACMLVNTRVELGCTNLVHTDQIHKVYEKDDVRSEPTYIGGENFFLNNPPTKKATIGVPSNVRPARPKIAFYNSMFRLHMSVALTGVDLGVPNSGNEEEPNNSTFRFYQNGTAYSDGTGRQMILGTQIGSTPCDRCCVAVSKDSHIDVFQDVRQAEGDVTPHTLTFDTAPNNELVIEELPESVGVELHTVYLGHSSNMSIGTAGDEYVPAYFEDAGDMSLTTFPTVIIGGNYFSFETRGGRETSPEASAITGRGGIFVDTNGTLTIGSLYRANMSAMVTKSGNAIINLPMHQVFFDSRVGIAAWKLDLTDASQRTVVAPFDILSDYTLNWRDVTKDYDGGFIPFLVSDMEPDDCLCPAVTEGNLTSLPTVSGLVEQFQIKGSRLYSQAHLMVDNGWIRELVFLCGCESADAPVAVVALKNNGRVGLGTDHRNRDSLGASVVMGVNGITIIADGDGRVDLNEDVIINNVCHILRGPNFDPDGEEVPFNKLQFYSDCERCLIVKSSGVLDLSTFTESNHFVEFAGNMKLLLEPGATVVMGGGVLRVADHARIESTPVVGVLPVQVRFIGIGTVQLDEDAVFQVGDDSHVSVETFATSECTSHPICKSTDLYFDLRGRSKMIIGTGSGTNSSVFQVGNDSFTWHQMAAVPTRQEQIPATIDFRLALNGVDSEFIIRSRGFFGLGVGMKQNTEFRPSDWEVNTLFNVTSLRIDVSEGTFRHDRIFNSDDPFASLLAIIDTRGDSKFTFNYISPITSDTTQATILGGGNMVLVEPAVLVPPLNPTVQETDGVINDRLTVGLFSSKAVLEDPNHVAQPANPMTGAQLFTFWKTADIFPFATMFINASEDEHNLVSVGYADASAIVRGLISQIVGQGGIPVARTDFDHTFNKGSLFADLGFGAGPRPVGAAFELP